MGPFLYQYRNKDIDYDTISYVVVRDHSSFRYVPDKYQDRILNLLDKSFFNKEGLNKLYNVKMPGKLYNKYFGHIPLYILYDYDISSINQKLVWEPGTFLGYCGAGYLSTYKVDDKSNVIINTNYIRVTGFENGLVGPITRM
jgi:hypothetical protein